MRTTPTQLWIVGDATNHPSWSVVGVFSSEQKAVAECKDHAHFVAPVSLDHAQHPDKTWEGLRYPLSSDPTVQSAG